MINENLLTTEKLQGYVKLGKKNISEKELLGCNVDINIKKQKFKNILLKKDFLGDWTLSLVDEYADLNGNKISENKKLLHRIKTLWENGKREISFKELVDMNIWTPVNELRTGNFKLYSGVPDFDSYTISLIDSDKNIDNLWTDDSINADRILSTLHKFDISRNKLILLTEVQLNRLLEDHFKKYFVHVKKGGYSNKGLIDLILGDMVYGIELKLARELRKNDQCDRIIAQFERYKEQFKSNLMLIIAGSGDEKQEKYIQDVIKKIKKMDGTYYYLLAD